MSTETSVSCRQVDGYLTVRWADSGAEMPEQIRVHLEHCERCAALYRWVCLDETDPEVPEKLESEISARLRASLKPVKPLPAGWRLAARFLLIFGLLFAILLGLLGTGGVWLMSEAELVSIAVILGAAAVFLSLSLSWQMVPGARQRIPAPLLIGVFAAGFVLIVALLFPWEQTRQILSEGWGCTLSGLAIAVPVGAVLALLVVRGAPLSCGVLGASLGAISGLLAVTVLQFSCSDQHAGHILLWHGAVLLISVCAGYLLGRLGGYITRRRIGVFN